VQDARWEVAVKNLLVTTVLCLAFLDPPAAAAQTIRYDVTTSTFIFFTSPGLATTTERIEITDRGPQADPDVTPRWESEALPIVVWDVAPGHLSTPDLFVFGNHCASIPAISGEPLARVVQDEHGGGNFAWVPGQNPLDGSIDPYGFFCLKGSHQSTTTWSEWVSIGKRVYATAPPPPAQQVTIALAANQVVRGSTPVRITAAGFATGVLRYFISIDDAQKWFWYTTPTTITQWWGTTTYPNGTHSITVRVTDTAGKTGTATVSVLVRN
jgi:hypothetical protein